MSHKTTPKIRNLKVYSRFNNPTFSKYSILPEIRLKGNWLKEWGFACGSEIQVIKTKFGISILKKDQSPPIIVL